MSEFPGRRAALRSGRKVRPATAIGVGAPLVTLVALLVQAPADTQDDVVHHVPATQSLTSADLFCPPSGNGPVRLVSTSTAGTGTVTRRTPGSADRVGIPLAAGASTTYADPAGMLVHADGALAPGLLGARLGSPRPAASECAVPGGVRWYVGAGSGASHLSTLTLANPDGGPAVADVSIWSTDGELEKIQSRGLTIDAGQASTLPLEQLAPNAHELAVRVIVTRGRLAATVRDEFGKVGEAMHGDALPAGAAPALHQVIAGIGRTANSRVLTLVNPGRSEAQVTLRLAGAQDTFAPAGVGQIRVPAGRVVVTDLTAALKKLTTGEDMSLLVDSTAAVGAGLRSTVAGDLVHDPGLHPRTGPTGAVVPGTGTATLLVAAGAEDGDVRVRWGTGAETVAKVAAGTTLAIPAPAGAWRVTVDGDVPVAAVLRTQSKKGAALLPLRPLVTDLLVPAVRPAWPPS
jgi:hypothetical protein